MRLLTLEDDGEFSLIEFIGDKIRGMLYFILGSDSEEIHSKT
jgi:hypothetical protein